MTPDEDPRRFLLDLFRAAVASGDPQHCVPRYLPPKPRGKTVVVGAGKAAAGMAKAVEASWDGPVSGLVVCPHGCGVPTCQVEVVEASHPLPDEAGTRAAQRMLSLVQGLSENDLVLALISGGGSALLTLPAPALELEDKQAVTQKLLKSGATIAEINCVRKHLSAIKGGRLAAAAWPARVHALAISDVPGDDPSVIASGPTVADPTTSADALAVIERYGIAISDAIRQWLSDAASETPKPGDVRLSRSTFQFVSRPVDALYAAADAARAVGVRALILGDSIEGEAREVGRVMAGIALSAASSRVPVEPPCVLLSGGETTVTVRGTGSGGRNREFALSLAIALAGRYDICAIACDTDGIDGAADAAGAIVVPDTILRAHQKGLDPQRALAANDAGGLFGRLGDQVVTGPTGTNLNDFRAIYVPGPSR
jgi:glycerate 2-kinase